MILTDAHLHLADGPLDGYGDFRSLGGYMACTARMEEWAAVSEAVCSSRSYGIHPWYCGDWDAGVSDRLRNLLEEDRAAGVGEIGLDSKCGSVAEQLPVFEAQLSLASEMVRVVSIHDVGCEKTVLDAVRAYDGFRGVILHSYSSDSYVKPFAEAGCHFSIGPRLLSRSDVRVSRLLKSIPLDRLLLESDAPHFPAWFCGMGDFVGRIARHLDMEAEDLAEAVSGNYGRLVRGRGLLG